MRTKGKGNEGKGSGWRAIGLGTIVGILTSVALVGVTAALIAAGALGEGTADVGVLLSCAVGCLCAARLVRGQGRTGTVYGAAIGFGAAVLLGLTGLLLYSHVEMGRCAAVTAACLLGGAAGGVCKRRPEVRRRSRGG